MGIFSFSRKEKTVGQAVEGEEKKEEGRLERKRKPRRSCYGICLLLIVSLLLTSCKGIAISGKTENVPGYTEQEVMILLGSERNRYQNILGKEIWNLPITGQIQKTYGAYFIEKNKEFLQDIRTLNLLAEEKGIIPNSAEMESIRKAANTFYTALSPEDKAYFGNCTEKDVVDIYTAYFTAEKTVRSLLSSVDTELSAAEAKVISIEQIVLSDEATAKDLLEKVKAQGANFSYYARQYSEDPEIQKELSFGEKEDAYYEAAFALENGELSSIISENGKYYILHCLNSYDEEATKDRRARLEKSIRALRFNESYEAYQKEHIIRFREPFWKNIDLNGGEGSTADFFFSVYQENVKTEE